MCKLVNESSLHGRSVRESVRAYSILIVSLIHRSPASVSLPFLAEGALSFCSDASGNYREGKDLTRPLPTSDEWPIVAHSQSPILLTLHTILQLKLPYFLISCPIFFSSDFYFSSALHIMGSKSTTLVYVMPVKRKIRKLILIQKLLIERNM